MLESGKSPNSIHDDQLAEFTDQVLADKVQQADANADEELLALEETVVRLRNAFPPPTLNQATVKQMQVRFNARVRREAQEVKQPFWKKIFEPQARLQFGMAFAVIAALIAFVVLVPSPDTGGSFSGTALNPPKTIFVVIVLLGMLVVAVWAKRRNK